MTTGRRVVDRIDTLADWPATPDARYLLATGATTGATSQAQTLTNGVITGKIYPPANSTNALGLYRANGTTQDFYYDSTNGRVGIGGVPGASFSVNGTIRLSSTAPKIEWQDDTASVNSRSLVLQPYGTDKSASVQLVPSGAATTSNITLYSTNNVDSSAGTGLLAFGSGFSGYRTGTWGFASVIAGSINADSRDITFHVSSTAKGRFETLTLKNSGNVGLQTASPVTTLDVSDPNATTNAVQNAITMRSANAGTPAAGFGIGFRAGLKSSTTDDQNAGRLTWEWDVATHASRASRGKLSAYYTTTERICIDWKADSSVPYIGFLGATPVAKPAAYTQIYSAAARTVAAYTTDAENAAYTGIDNAQAGTVYAQLTDVNALRTAYENLRASHDGLLQVVNSIIDDVQAYGLFA